MARWGLDYDSLQSRNPGLVYASVTGKETLRKHDFVCRQEQAAFDEIVSNSDKRG